MWCWGANGKGQLGNGTRNASDSPVQVTGATGAGVYSGSMSNATFIVV